MTTVTKVVQAMQTILTHTADQAAHLTRFVQRRSKLSGAAFVQTLVFGWLANPQATLEELAQTAATRGVRISPQGLEQRFTPAAAQCLQQVLESSLATLIETDPVAIPLLQRFHGVYLLDSSVIALPTALAQVWPGGGGSSGPRAALKLQVRFELSRGRLELALQAGRAHDCTTPFQSVPAGALRLADLGYFDLGVLAQLQAQGSYWLTRVKAGTRVGDQGGRLGELAELLSEQASHVVDRPIELGQVPQLACRLIAVRVPEPVANQRRRRLHKEARRKGQAVSQARLALADWTIFATNLSVEQLSVAEALVLGRVRWQIELLFKLWKSQGQLDQSRSSKPWRVLCEVYAKLVALLIQHWICLASGWQYADRSLSKAAQTLSKQAGHLASVFDCALRVAEVLGVIQRCLAAGCRINKRRADPHTFQLLLQFDHGGLA